MGNRAAWIGCGGAFVGTNEPFVGISSVFFGISCLLCEFLCCVLHTEFYLDLITLAVHKLEFTMNTAPEHITKTNLSRHLHLNKCEHNLHCVLFVCVALCFSNLINLFVHNPYVQVDTVSIDISMHMCIDSCQFF